MPYSLQRIFRKITLSNLLSSFLLEFIHPRNYYGSMKIYKSQTLAQLGELALIEQIKSRLPLRADVITGAGDDCAVVRGTPADKYDYLLKSDGVVEGVHFKKQDKAGLIGRKALGRVLSDIAAMGGEPLWILVDLVAPGQTSVKRIEEIYAGMIKLAKLFKSSIVGGDVSAGKELQLHVFGVGRVKKNGAVLRRGARAGDAIFVTGSLGGSLAGKHLNFQPRLREGQWLARGKWATAMIDISDGLLRDLGHIIKASKVGAQIMLEAIPISASVVGHVSAHGSLMNNPPRLTATPPLVGNSRELYHALGDGEDYELLFTVPKKKVESFMKAWRRAFRLACVRIGWITAQKGSLEGIDSGGRIIKLNAAGFEHFR